MPEQIVQYVLSSVINIAATIYILSKLLHARIDFKNYKLYIGYLILVIVGVLNVMFITGFFRIIVMTSAICLIDYYYFRKDFRQTLVSAFLMQIIATISEIIYITVIIVLLHIDSVAMQNSVIGAITTNIFISLLMVIIVNIPYVRRIYDKLILITNKVHIKTLSIAILMIFLPINILVYASYSQLGMLPMLIINVIFILIFVFIMVMALNEKNENLRYKAENNMLIENLHDYEKMMDHQRVANHENKNQLLVIKGMVAEKDESVVDYINEVIKDSRTDNESILSKAKKIPSGGLQGLVYQKLLVMQEKGIKADLDINKEIKEFKFQNLSTKNNYNLCRIIGVLIDNAIEESIKTEEKEIKISMYVDKGFIIEVSNYFKDMPDLEKISEKGYTTKGSGHGYGLSLVKEIIEETNEFENRREITKNVFTQKIKIKM